MVGLLPNLLIIGAGKAATTSLHAYLDLHPSISMAARKELQLFNRDDWEDQLDWYRAQFLVRAPVRGESSPAYSMDPVVPNVPERVRSVMPGARILYVVRDPIERLLAHYVEFVFILREKRTFEEAMADYDAPSNVYVMASRYAHQLERWRSCFDASQIMVIDQRELLSERRNVLGEVFRFLEVDDSFWTPDFDRLHNTRQRKLLVNRRGLWIVRRGLYDHWLRAASLLPERFQKHVRGVLGEEIERPVPDAALRAKLEAVFRDDAERLRAYTGKSFDGWSV